MKDRNIRNTNDSVYAEIHKALEAGTRIKLFSYQQDFVDYVLQTARIMLTENKANVVKRQPLRPGELVESGLE